MKTPKTDKERRELINRLARRKSTKDLKPGRMVSEEFWELPWPEDPEGMARRHLIEDRREGR